jgi:hypothetical protein
MCTGNCNCSCDQVTIPSITGPAGVNGLNSFTTTTATFVMPSIGSNVTLAVSNTNPFTGIWAQLNQDIYIQSAGYFRVVSSTATSIVCTNLGVVGNTVPGTTVTNTRYVVPSGRSANVVVNRFEEALYVSTPQSPGSYDTLDGSTASSIIYEDYALSVNGNKITTQAAVQLSASSAGYTSFQFTLGGTVCFTSILNKYPPNGRVNFKVEIWRISDTTVQVEATEQVVTPNNSTITYAYHNDVLAIADLDTPGNYSVNLNFSVSSDVAHILTWQSLNSTK